MAFREVGVTEIREVLRLWLLGRGLRKVAELTGLDRKTVRRYVEAAQVAGLGPDDGESALTDELIGEVVEAVRPVRPDGHGAMWGLLAVEHEWLKERVGEGLKLTKVAVLLERRLGVGVPYATLHRYAVGRLGFGRRRDTVPLTDGEPGSELQVDFGRMGLLHDEATGRRRVVYGLLFTACYSRHQFVWLTFSQALPAVIDGFEAACGYFGGVFAVVIPDNVKAVVTGADDVAPVFNQSFVEYAQARGFVVDPARVRHPKDKARVERNVAYVRDSFFAGEQFTGLDDAQARADRWCLTTAGQRIHGSTHRRPLEVFTAQEAPHLLAAPTRRYDLPVYATCKVHRDHHIEVAKALYSVPGGLVGECVQVRADAALVRISHRGRPVKTHPRVAPGKRSTDADDLPAERSAYALRDIDKLIAQAASHGDSVGEMARRLMDIDLSWTKMRQAYRLLGLVRRFGPQRVQAACTAALELDVVDVTKVARMLDKALEPDAPTEPAPPQPPLPPNVLRFARPAEQFRTGGAS